MCFTTYMNNHLIEEQWTKIKNGIQKYLGALTNYEIENPMSYPEGIADSFSIAFRNKHYDTESNRNKNTQKFSVTYRNINKVTSDLKLFP